MCDFFNFTEADLCSFGSSGAALSDLTRRAALFLLKGMNKSIAPPSQGGERLKEKLSHFLRKRFLPYLRECDPSPLSLPPPTGRGEIERGISPPLVRGEIKRGDGTIISNLAIGS